MCRKLPYHKLLVSGLALTMAAQLGACSPQQSMDMRDVTANRIALPAHMTEQEIPAGLFTLTARHRIHKNGAPATIYIEGDGLAWLSKRRPSLDPTPTNPVGLHLASRDHAENLVYLARPCQFTPRKRAGKCDRAYWMQKRFAPEVIESYQIALDKLQARHGITGFNLVGYSGGANIAAILAAERDDVVSLRTVAGNLDHVAISQIHDVSPLTGSLNAKDYAAKLAKVPQHHFVGSADEVVPPSVYHSFRQAMGSSRCVHYTLVPNADHSKGWVQKWPELLRHTLKCQPEEKGSDQPLPPPEHIQKYKK